MTKNSERKQKRGVFIFIFILNYSASIWIQLLQTYFQFIPLYSCACRNIFCERFMEISMWQKIELGITNSLNVTFPNFDLHQNSNTCTSTLKIDCFVKIDFFKPIIRCYLLQPFNWTIDLMLTFDVSFLYARILEKKLEELYLTF